MKNTNKVYRMDLEKLESLNWAIVNKKSVYN